MATHAEHRRAVVARRTGRGTWYAVVTAYRQEPTEITRHVLEANAKGANLAEVVEAGQRLMAEKVHWLGPDVIIDVLLYAALEWQRKEV